MEKCERERAIQQLLVLQHDILDQLNYIMTKRWSRSGMPYIVKNSTTRPLETIAHTHQSLHSEEMGNSLIGYICPMLYYMIPDVLVTIHFQGIQCKICQVDLEEDSRRTEPGFVPSWLSPHCIPPMEEQLPPTFSSSHAAQSQKPTAVGRNHQWWSAAREETTNRR